MLVKLLSTGIFAQMHMKNQNKQREERELGGEEQGEGERRDQKRERKGRGGRWKLMTL